MDIFELVNNEKFFNPLSSQNRKIYFECIVLLFEKSREVPILYDSDARNCVTLYLKNSKYVFKDEYEEEVPETQAPERSASSIMAYLRECGWVTPREIGRNGDNMAELKNELLDLKDSIANIMRIVMEFQDANSVGKFLMKDELLDKFFNDYFFIKNNGFVPADN